MRAWESGRAGSWQGRWQGGVDVGPTRVTATSLLTETCDARCRPESAVLKTGRGQLIEGSNPSASASLGEDWRGGRCGRRCEGGDAKGGVTSARAAAGGRGGRGLPAGELERLEHLCRYVTRPPIATQRLALAPDGRVIYGLKRHWRDGTSAVS
ncbi:MAG: transposase, partial [Deltaproteobacteria bacterium]|nr:transposase [Deltaproteobacteria bacterium]